MPLPPEPADGFRTNGLAELLDFSKVAPKVDNLEGMAFGPVLGDGRQSLIIVSDNNYSSHQVTRFMALALTIKSERIDETAIFLKSDPTTN